MLRAVRSRARGVEAERQHRARRGGVRRAGLRGGLLPLTTPPSHVRRQRGDAHVDGERRARLDRHPRLALPPSRDPTPWHALDADGVLGRLSSTRPGLTRATRRFAANAERSSLPTQLARARRGHHRRALQPARAAARGRRGPLGGGRLDGGRRHGRRRRRAQRGHRRRAALLDGAKAPRARAHGATNARPFAATGTSTSSTPRSSCRATSCSLATGDVVPADCRILEATALEVDASSLTGESLPVKKFAAPSFETQPADRSSMLYEGTTVAAGQATAVVVAVGAHTEARRGADRLEGRSRSRRRRATAHGAHESHRTDRARGGRRRGRRRAAPRPKARRSRRFRRQPRGRVRAGRAAAPRHGGAARRVGAPVASAAPSCATRARSRRSGGSTSSVSTRRAPSPRAHSRCRSSPTAKTPRPSTTSGGSSRRSSPPGCARPRSVSATGRERAIRRTRALLRAAHDAGVNRPHGCVGFRRQAELSLSFGRSYHAVLGQRRRRCRGYP